MSAAQAAKSMGMAHWKEVGIIVSLICTLVMVGKFTGMLGERVEAHEVRITKIETVCDGVPQRYLSQEQYRVDQLRNERDHEEMKIMLRELLKR